MKATFQRQGFVVVENLLDRALIDELYRTTVKVFLKYRPGDEASLRGPVPFDNNRFHERMIRLRAEAPQLFGALYDTVQVSVALQQLVCSHPVVEAAAQLLDDEPTALSATGHMLRMDPPGDTRNSLDWHQEASYYDQNRRGENGIVCWIPMRDVQPDHGSVLFCPGSHLAGHVRVPSTGKRDYGTSEQFRTPPEIVDRYSPHRVSARAGDVVFFHMYMIHRTGNNISTQMRFSAGVRFHRMLTDDFLPGRFQYLPNKSVQDMLGAPG